MKISIVLHALLALGSLLMSVNDRNFKEIVLDSGKFTLVDFYADWCRHCMHLMPTIQELADVFAETPDVQIVKLNGDKDGKKTTRKYDIPGFPTLLMFHNDDNPIEFVGLRDLDSITNFVRQFSGSKSEQISEDDELCASASLVEILDDSNFEERVLRLAKKTVVAFTAPWCRYCQELSPLWEKLASKVYDADSDVLTFGVVDFGDARAALAEKVAAQFEISHLPTVLFFDPSKVDKDGMRRPTKFQDLISLENLIAFVNDETGLSRNSEGLLYESAGRVLEIDEMIANQAYSLEEIIGRVEEMLSEVSDSSFQKLLNDGKIFYKDDLSMLQYYKTALIRRAKDKRLITKELQRLQQMRLTDSDSITKSSLDFIIKRVNILNQIDMR